MLRYNVWHNTCYESIVSKAILLIFLYHDDMLSMIVDWCASPVYNRITSLQKKAYLLIYGTIISDSKLKNVT
jgi:hypothetical protein